jgi:hypothetical protein
MVSTAALLRWCGERIGASSRLALLPERHQAAGAAISRNPFTTTIDQFTASS